MSISFCTIASGSSGNSAFVSVGKNKILVDAGLSGRAIEEGLRAVGIDPRGLSAIFVTHEHGDHIKGAGVLSRRHKLPIYMTAGTKAGARELGKIAPGCLRLVRAGVPVALDGVEVMPFAVCHDALEPVGYTFTTKSHKIAITTDLGHATDSVAAHLLDSDIILIESNHDIDMLKNGSYPADLKARILSPLGHLSNAACGELLAKIITEKTKHIFLAHLSEENNHPAIALNTVQNILTANNIKTDGLHIANRHHPSQLITL
ncbi:MAG: MBL fold metallo-hydrolase [Defluviitaleaceae bacterium]|nr:MBL fold metallo-hydrolase [Defluviitaleaceae bacterium]